MVLGEFLREIKNHPDNVNFPDMVNIVVVHSTSNGKKVRFKKYKTFSVLIYSYINASGN